MHNEKNDNNDGKISDPDTTHGSQISGLGQAAGCRECTGCGSYATQDEQETTPDPIGKPVAVSPGSGTLRPKRPLVAIREAKRRAAIWGFSVIGIQSEDPLPYDFVAMKDGITSFVRVRRISDSWFNIRIIEVRCRKQIAEFRAMNQKQGLNYELWIRGFARAFHRYRILPDSIEEIGTVLEPETRAGRKALEDATVKTARPDIVDESPIENTTYMPG